jgi:hypothetical protein
MPGQQFDQPDGGDRHNVIKNNLPLVTKAERELNEGSKKNFVNYATAVYIMQIRFC